MSRPLEISSAPDRCKLLEQHPFSLRFKSPAIEAAYLHQVAVSRLPVLVAIAVFDICMFFVRLIVASSMGHAGGISNIPVWAQLRNLAVLYSLLSLFYWRSKKEGATSAQVRVRASYRLPGVSKAAWPRL